MKKIMLALTICFPLIIAAQKELDNQNEVRRTWQGIQWTEGLSWKEVQKKAKKEKKYIFMDCFTTWCSPCKYMEQNTFLDSAVSKYFNQNFISVRLQMDKTRNDDDAVRRWYPSATTISKKYGIPAYPTFLFFSPDVELAYRGVGLKYPHELINLASKALEPNMKAPYRIYYSLLANYQHGKKEYATMAGLADTAKMLLQDDIAAAVSKDYRAFLLSKKKSEWFSAKNLSFMSNFIQGSKDPFFTAFYDSGKETDKILGRAGFSENIVDIIIQSEEIESVTKPVKGVHSSNEDLSANKEPDWGALQEKTALKYTASYAERNVLYARTLWYMEHHEWAVCAKYLTLFTIKYPPIYFDSPKEVFFNTIYWSAIFGRSVDKDQIDAAINCLRTMIDDMNKRDGAPPAVLDTYANILYKAGRKEEAIRQEEEAAKKDEQHEVTLQRMKQGKPTWPHYVTSDFFDGGLID